MININKYRYIEGHKPLGGEVGRDMAIQFLETLKSDEAHKAVCFIKPLLKELKSIDSDNHIIGNAIDGMEVAFNTDFTCKTSISYYISDMKGNLGYVYSFYPDEIVCK